jgi:hypothetical protein
MPRLARSLLCALALVSLDACLASHTQHEDPPPVEAELAAVTLADDCAGESRFAGDAAPCPAGTECPSFCRQSSVQVHIDATELDDASVPFEVVSIRLLEMDGTPVDELDSRNARLLVDGVYAAWDEQIAPGVELDVSYDTSAPEWSADAFRVSHEYRVEMDVRIDGVVRTLELAPVMREPEIVT